MDRLGCGLTAVRGWMKMNEWKLNSDKMGVLSQFECASGPDIAVRQTSIRCGQECVPPTLVGAPAATLLEKKKLTTGTLWSSYIKD